MMLWFSVRSTELSIMLRMGNVFQMILLSWCNVLTASFVPQLALKTSCGRVGEVYQYRSFVSCICHMLMRWTFCLIEIFRLIHGTPDFIAPLHYFLFLGLLMNCPLMSRPFACPPIHLCTEAEPVSVWNSGWLTKSRNPGVRNYYFCEVTAILAVVCLHVFVCFMSETTELDFVEFSFVNGCVESSCELSRAVIIS
jgi:hypothetical protein